MSGAEDTLWHAWHTVGWWWIVKAALAILNIALMSMLSAPKTVLGRIGRTVTWMGMMAIALTPLNGGLGPAGDILLQCGWACLLWQLAAQCRKEARTTTRVKAGGKISMLLFDR